jgi:hypothetical protein
VSVKPAQKRTCEAASADRIEAPVEVGEDTIGGIAVGGAPGGDKDEACALAGIDKNEGAAELMF